MNLHKTIGFLASLLLMVGIGVPDSFAQNTITLTLSPSTVQDNVSATTVTATAALTRNAAVTADTDYTVTVQLPSSAAYVGRPSVAITVTISNGGSSGSESGEFVVTPIQDKDADDTVVMARATATGYTADTAELTITDNPVVLAAEADAVSGYRVIITAPAVGKWANVGNNKVKVQVLRREGPSFQWGSFDAIRIGLYDESGDGEDVDTDTNSKRPATAEPIYSMTISNGTTGELANLSLDSVKRDTLTAESGSNGTTAYYTRRSRSGNYDKLEFWMAIPAGTIDTDADLLKTYAVARFTEGGDTVGELESRDTETAIHPVFPNEKVGDGKLIKIDRTRPAAITVTNMTVTVIDGNDTDNGSLGIGDELEISADVSGVFQETSVQFQIIVPEAMTVDTTPADLTDDETVVIAADGALTGYTKTFTGQEIFSNSNKLTDKFKVTANQFKRKYTIKQDPLNDPPKYEKNDLVEQNQLSVRAHAIVKDKAGNAQDQYVGSETALNDEAGDNDTENETDGLSGRFTLDSKPPKVTIVYPKPSAPDSNRFTALDEQTYAFLGDDEVTVDLNPLKFKVDEGVESAYVVIDGGGAALKDTTDLLGAGAPIQGENTVNLALAANKHRTYERTDNGKNDTKRASAEGGYNKGTKTAKVTVAATDLSGNTGKASPSGGDPIFDNKKAALTKLFPNNADLEPYDNKIGGPEGTQHPVFRLNEKVDSILVRYLGTDILDVAGTAAQEATVNNNIRVKFLGDQGLQQNEVYDLQVYVRDLAGYVTLSVEQTNLTFDNDLENPAAGAFKLATLVRKFNTAAQFAMDKGHVKMDSVVANQGMRLDITALDAALSESAGEDRVAVTYANAGVKVVVENSDGNPEPTAKFWGGASGNGTATLNDLGWSGGKRSIFFRVTKAGSYTVVVQDMNADGTLNFKKTTDIVVDAADFQQFEITAWEEGVDGSVTNVWGDFDLRVTPTDKYGNASLKTFHNFAGTGKVNPVAAQDSLDILDTRVGKTAPTPENAANSTKKYAQVDVSFNASLIEDLPFAWSVREAGETFSVRTQENRTRGTARVRAVIDNSFLLLTDSRSRNKSGDASFTIQQPLDISITLWVPGVEGDQAGNDVAVSADGVTVTARAEGLNEGDMVIFTVDGDGQDAVEADADGYAGLDITRSAAGTVTVSAASGQYSSDDLTITFVEAPAEPVRMAYVDAEGDPVYLISDLDMVVGVDDFLALVAAFGTSPGDENYNIQADIDDNGTIDVEDFLLFIQSFGKTAVGPATKPLVLLPGINENAEFALSLGSDRVIAGEMVAVDVSIANVESLIGYGFTLNYDADKFEFISVASADEDLLKSTGGETLFHHVAGDGQVEVATGLYNGTAVSGGGDIVRFVFRVLYEFEDNARFEIANGLVFDPSQLQNPAVVAGVLELQSTPREFALHQNFPNPFNPDTTIKYDLAESADVTLQIYNVLGQVVRTLVASEAQNAGRYQIRWNGMDERGVPVSSGIYFYQIAADGKFSDVRKLMLLK